MQTMIKGSAMIHAVKALRHWREQAESVLPESLHGYLDSKILVTQWYPDADFMAIVRVLAEVLPAPEEGHWPWIGRVGASANFTGIYAALVKLGDPAETLRRYPKMWRIHHNAGKVTMRSLGPKEARLEILHPLAAEEDFCLLQIGHVGELATLAGAADVEVEVLRVGTAREPAAWRISWR